MTRLKSQLRLIQRPFIKVILTHFAVLALFVFLAFAYLAPGTSLLLANDKTQVMSDGSDPATLPYQYSIILQNWDKSPIDQFYGAVPARTLNPPHNFPLWIPWIEKWTVLALSRFVALEQLSTAFVFIILILNGYFFFLMGRAFRWGTSLSIAAGIAYAFCSYTRARAKVHMALAGVFHLPAIFLGLYLLRKANPGRKNILIAMALFFFSAWVAHYYLLLTAFLSPVFLIYFYLSPEVRANWRASTLRLITASLPAVLFLVWCLKAPMPAKDLTAQTILVPITTQAGPSGFHPFTELFASRPIDYLAGDTAISEQDINPLRSWITSSIYQNLDGSNPHERANGIRWVILLFFGVTIFWAFRKDRNRIYAHSKNEARFFIGFGLLAFLISLGPIWFDMPIGLSALLHKALPEFRVPSRAGIYAQFGTIAAVGVFLSSWARQNTSRFKYLILAPVLVLADFPPYQAPMPTSRILPAVNELPGFASQNCGKGMYIPYVSGTHEMIRFYYFLQEMRGTDCTILNAMNGNSIDSELLKRLPLIPQIKSMALANNPDLRAEVVRFARCAKLDWISFDFELTDPFIQSVCNELKWPRLGPRICQRSINDRESNQHALTDCSDFERNTFNN